MRFNHARLSLSRGIMSHLFTFCIIWVNVVLQTKSLNTSKKRRFIMLKGKQGIGFVLCT